MFDWEDSGSEPSLSISFCAGPDPTTELMSPSGRDQDAVNIAHSFGCQKGAVVTRISWVLRLVCLHLTYHRDYSRQSAV